MIYGKQDWAHNYFAAIGAEDYSTGNGVLIDTIAKLIAFNRDAVIGVIESSGIEIKHDASALKVMKVLQDNLSKNRKLQQNLAKLLLGERYQNSIGDVVGETYVSTKGMVDPKSDLGKDMQTGEILANLLGSLFKSTSQQTKDQKEKDAQLKYEQLQEQNKQLENKVKLYTGLTETSKKNTSIVLVVVGVLALAGLGYWLIKRKG